MENYKLKEFNIGDTVIVRSCDACSLLKEIDNLEKSIKNDMDRLQELKSELN